MANLETSISMVITQPKTTPKAQKHASYILHKIPKEYNAHGTELVMNVQSSSLLLIGSINDINGIIK